MVAARDYEAICDLGTLQWLFFFNQIILQPLNIIFMGIKVPNTKPDSNYSSTYMFVVFIFDLDYSCIPSWPLNSLWIWDWRLWILPVLPPLPSAGKHAPTPDFMSSLTACSKKALQELQIVFHTADKQRLQTLRKMTKRWSLRKERTRAKTRENTQQIKDLLPKPKKWKKNLPHSSPLTCTCISWQAHVWAHPCPVCRHK